MLEGGFSEFSEGKFVGKIDPRFLENLDASRLRDFSKELQSPEGRILAQGRHQVVMLPFLREGQSVEVVVKAFGRQNRLKDLYDSYHGSKASRSFQAANFLFKNEVGTPEPIGYFERWEGLQLMESYYLSSYLDSLTSVRDLLFQMYERYGDCAHFVRFLKHLAQAIRKMHDVGFCHYDLGNQNMELTGTIDGNWGEIQFVDLNRGKIKNDLSPQERAIDFARLRLPSAFLDILIAIYWDDQPPKEFISRLKSLRRRFDLWEKSRSLRHPFRKRSGNGLLRVQDIWIWDRESAQASITMNRDERKKYYPKGRHLAVAQAVTKEGIGVWKEYQRLLPQAFTKKVELAGRFGMALEATDLEFQQQRKFLARLSPIPIPVLLRFCHHEGRAQWERTLTDLESLHSEGYQVMIAMVQCRRSVLDPESWREFLEFVIGRAADMVTMVELCHAVNRMKWGVHSSQEQGMLLEPVVALQKKYPQVKFTGPACIDFEYHYVLSALEETPREFQYAALSHHLYVDRRGAPENFQSKFSTVEKAALLQAIARSSSRCSDQVIISEVNWPIKGTGIWSPVGATYWPAGQPESKLNVSEEEYGWYMLRYLVLTICSGFVEQVYWWRLVSHGFGLVDERAEDGWRERPGFLMLQFFLTTLGEATFLEKLPSEEGVYALKFQTNEGEVVMGWAHGAAEETRWSSEHTAAYDAYGEKITSRALSEAPAYFFLER